MGKKAAQIGKILEQAQLELVSISTLQQLTEFKARYLGKKSELTAILRAVGSLIPEQRAVVGSEVNRAKDQLIKLIQQHTATLKRQLLAHKLATEKLDVTLPGRKQSNGSLHPVTLVQQRFEKIFNSMGFTVAEGPEIESDYYNFTALNFPPEHPARAEHDTFFFADGSLLRTHTSPVQIRVMETNAPPLRVIVPGRVFRCDYDATHTPMFHQLEGFVVDSHTNFAELKSLLNNVLETFFNEKIQLRMRASYFPFTEPSAEVDFCCVVCKGKGCSLCGGSGWIEGLGCGMIHPNVFKAGNIDSERFNGFAFGIGLDRIAMFYYKINDLRLIFDNDLRFLEQF